MFAAIAVAAVIAFNSSTDTPRRAIGSLPAEVKISGFGDFISTNLGDNAGAFRIGQAEVNLEAPLGPSASVAMAIAYDGEVVALASFVVGSERHFTQRLGIRGVGIWAGRFDVPFGIDYHCYASADRRLVTTPEIVTRAHGCWNDVGVHATIGAPRWNATAFATNGEVADDANAAVGARVGVVVAPQFEVGTSYAVVEAGPTGDEAIAGFDARTQVDRLALKGEYISRTSDRTSAGVYGFYVGGEVDFGRWFVIERYGEVTDEIDAQSVQELSSGVGAVLGDACEVRIEHRARRETDAAVFAQIVVTF